MIYAIAVIVVASLGIITTLLVLYVRARDQLRKVETKTVMALQTEIGELTHDKETLTQILKNHEDTLMREHDVIEVLRKQLAEARDLVETCSDPVVLSESLTKFFSEPEQ